MWMEWVVVSRDWFLYSASFLWDSFQVSTVHFFLQFSNAPWYRCTKPCLTIQLFPFIPSLSGVFIMKGYWVLSNNFSASIEVLMWVFYPFILLLKTFSMLSFDSSLYTSAASPFSYLCGLQIFYRQLIFDKGVKAIQIHRQENICP